tara:strand:- start:903 stop:2438 length:1536 start_codon:yes stop_codon:yes gene_type:complete
MLSTTREASNSRSLNGIISIDDGNGTIIENGNIQANSIEITQQMQIDGDIVCENLVASADIECLDLVASGDVTCDNVSATTNIVSSTASIGNLNTNFLIAGDIQVGDITDLEVEVNDKSSLTNFNIYTGINSFKNFVGFDGEAVNFSAEAVFYNKTSFLSKMDDDTNAYIPAIEIQNMYGVTQDTQSLCKITGTTGKLALEVNEGDVSITEKLILGSLTDVEVAITSKASSSQLTNGLNTKANINGGVNFVSSQHPATVSFKFNDYGVRSGGATASFQGTSGQLNTNFTGGKISMDCNQANGNALIIGSSTTQTSGSLVNINGVSSQTALTVVGKMNLGAITDVESAISNAGVSANNPTFTGTIGLEGIVNVGTNTAEKNLNVYGDVVMVNVNNTTGRSQLIFYEDGTNNARISHTTASSSNVTSRCLNFEILTSKLTEGFRFCASLIQLFRIDANGNTNSTGHNVFNASNSNDSGILSNGQTTTFCTNTQIQFRYKTTTGNIKTKTFNWD